MRTSLKHSFIGLAAGGACIFGSTVAVAYPVDLEVRPTAVPNSCDYGIFQPELRITNVADSPISLSSVFAEFAFNAAPGEIEAVHPETYASIFDADGAFVTWTGAKVEPSPWTTTGELSPDRRINQIWRVLFDPPRPNPPNLIPAGGYATVIVSLRRAGGAVPFDENCDDFTKVERDSSREFQSNPYFHLIFTSTQQLVCEQWDLVTNDPLSGYSFFAPFTSSCR